MIVILPRLLCLIGLFKRHWLPKLWWHMSSVELIYHGLVANEAVAQPLQLRWMSVTSWNQIIQQLAWVWVICWGASAGAAG